MQLVNLKLRNFLSFGDKEQEITFDKLETIVGPNDAGKTNIFRAISLVHHYLSENITQDEPYHHNGDLTRPLEVKLTIKFSKEEIEGLTNFLIGSILHESANVQSDEHRDNAIPLVEDFILKYAKHLASDLFQNVTINIKRKEDRPLYKGDHNLILGDPNHKLFLESYSRLSLEKDVNVSEYRAVDVCLELIRKKEPEKVKQYLKDEFGKLPNIQFSKDELSHIFFKFLNERPAQGLSFGGFNFGEGGLRKNYPEIIKLRQFLTDRGFGERGLNLIEVISTIFTSSIVRTSDLRSKPRAFLMPEDESQFFANLHNLSGENLPLILFNLWNSTKPSLRKRYNEIQEKFKEISNGTGFDVGIKSQKITQKGASSIVPMPNAEIRTDEITPAGIRQEEIQTIRNELVIRFLKGNMVIPLEFAAAGRFDTLLLLVALIGQSEKVILLDEPAANIHPILQRRILDEIETSVSENKNQAIIITHSPYLINPYHLENVWRISPEENGSKIINIKQALAGLDEEEERKIIKQLQESDVRSILFSKGAILVEGISDKIVVEKIDKYLSNNGKGANLEVEDWLVIDIGGKYSLASFIKLTKHLTLPFIGISDNDALMRCEKNLDTEKGKFLTSAIPIGLYNSKLLNDGYIDDLIGIQNSIEKLSIAEGDKKDEFWYSEEKRVMLNNIANSNSIFVFSKDLENALQSPTKRGQSKPLKDLNTVLKLIKENKITPEFYSMTEFLKANINSHS